MGKKNIKNENIEKELAHEDENLINDDISDDILLNEDLEDPLLDEMDAILHGKEYKPRPKPGKKQNLVNYSKKQEELKSNSTNIPNNLKISKQIVKEFTIFLLKKSKSYEEMSFQTILRKIPKEWQFTEPILIDTIENIIENKGITSFNMKMTAGSLKFYSIKKKTK